MQIRNNLVHIGIAGYYSY